MDNGYYKVVNPVDNDDNFADKWITHPQRQINFFQWLEKAKNDLGYNSLCNLDRVSLGKHILKIFGEKAGTQVYEQFAKESRNSIILNETKVDSHRGTLSKNGNLVIPPNHHHEG